MHSDLSNQTLHQNNSERSLMKSLITTTAFPDAGSWRQHTDQAFLLIWLYSRVDQPDTDCQNILAHLLSVTNNIYIFTEQDECIDFLTEVNGIKIILIVEGTLAKAIIPLVYDIPQLDSICIFCRNKSVHEQWTGQWVKVRGVHMEIICICEALQLAGTQYNQNPIALSFVAVSEGVHTPNTHQLEPSFIYTQIVQEILLEMKHKEQSVEDLVVHCRHLYNDNSKELNIINEFERDYRSKSPIWWYTRQCFIYQMIDRALRTLECSAIIRTSFFIRDLHQQIEELHKKQIDSYYGEPFLVYQGQVLSKRDLEKLDEMKGSLISSSNFLSTSKNRNASLGFVISLVANTDMVGILFKISIDPSVSSVPFASIQEVSYFHTEEVLFSMHTVFRIGEITKIDNNNLLYQVELKLTSENDHHLRTLTECIQKETLGETGWTRLGFVLVKMGQFDKAEELYKVLLERTSDDDRKVIYCNYLGRIKDNQGDFEMALSYYKNGLEICQRALPSNHPLLAISYSNIGAVHRNMGEYSEALSFYEKDLEIQQKMLLPNYLALATSYNNIASVYYRMEDYSKALSLYEKNLENYQKILPENHPDLATLYNNIASVYHKTEEYSKALSFYQKDLEISEKTLPPNHPDLAIIYNNIGGVYRNTGEYLKALSFYQRALAISQKSPSANQPIIKTVQKNIEILKQKIQNDG